MKRIAWAGPAAVDFHDIVDHLARESVGAAGGVVDHIDKALRQVAAHPRPGRVVPELDRHNLTQYRELVIAPWRLVCRPEDDRVLVLAVIDGRRNVEDILLHRLVRGAH